MRSFILAVFSLLLLACAMGPDYSRPDIPTSDSFRMAEEPKDLPSLANMPWWELYRDEELQRLIRIALEENKDLKRAVANIDEFQARLYTARMDFAPQLSATGNVPLARTGRRFCSLGFPVPLTIMGKDLCPGSWISGGESAERMRRAWRISWLGRRTDEPSLCKSWAAWRRPISIFGNSTCSWRSPRAHCRHGRSR